MLSHFLPRRIPCPPRPTRFYRPPARGNAHNDQQNAYNVSKMRTTSAKCAQRQQNVHSVCKMCTTSAKRAQRLQNVSTSSKYAKWRYPLRCPIGPLVHLPLSVRYNLLHDIIQLKMVCCFPKEKSNQKDPHRVVYRLCSVSEWQWSRGQTRIPSVWVCIMYVYDSLVPPYLICSKKHFFSALPSLPPPLYT